MTAQSTTSAAPRPPLSERDRRILMGLASRIDVGDPGAHNNLGVLYFNKGMLDEAVTQFQRALEIDPRMQVAQRNLDIAYFNSGYLHRLIRELSERLVAMPGDTAARRRLARAQISIGDHEAAARELGYLAAEAPDDLQTLLELGRVEKEAGRYDEALRWFQRGLALDPESGVFRFHAGELEYHRGALSEARGHLVEAIRLQPDFGDAHHLLAFVLGEMGDDDGAADAAERARELNPALGRAETNLSLDAYNPARYGELVGEHAARPEVVKSGYLAGYHLGVAYRQRGLYAEALREFERALERGEDDRLVRQAIAEIRLVRQEVDAAAKLYRALIRDDPGSPKLFNELGVALHLGGDPRAAELAYRRALESAPEYALAWNNLAVARRHQGDASAAGECLTRAVERHPKLVDAWCNLGLLAEQSGRLSEAVRAFRAAADADDDSAGGWVGMGRVLGEMGRFDEARNALARAVDLAPDSAAARYHLGFVLARLGEFDAARRETERAMALDAFYPAPRYRLAIDLQFEYAEVLAPELGSEGRLPAGDALPSFDFDTAELSEAFQALRRPAPADPLPGSPIDAGDSFRLARDYLSKGLLARAAAEVRRLVSAGAEPVEAALLTAEILMGQGYYGEALERYDSALVRLEEHPNDSRLGQIWLGRAEALLRLGRAAEAHEAANRARPYSGAETEALRSHGEAFMLEGNAVAAIETFQRLTTLQPEEPAAWRELGGALRLAGRLADAEAALTRALELDPEYVSARLALAELQVQLERLDDAAIACEQALETLPDYPDAVLLLAEIRRRERRLNEAVALLADHLSRDAYSIAGLLALGRVLDEDGRHADALRAVQRAMRLDPSHEEASRLLAAVEAHARAGGAWGMLQSATGARREA